MKYEKIVLMLPTYGRANTYLKRFIESALGTARTDIAFAFCVNKSDYKTHRFLNDFLFEGKSWIVVPEELPSPHLAKYFNMLYNEVLSEFGDHVVFTEMGDDFDFITPGWDEKILADINSYDGVGVFWVNDDYIAHERCPVNLFVTKKMVDATEEPFMCEDFEADYIDWIWGKVGKYTRTSHYRPDVVIKHNHNSRKLKEDWDPTYQRLHKIQCNAKETLGKKHARMVAGRIAERLISKGFVGNSIC